MSQSNKCYYEVIRENKPCKLYFDIEFEKKFNPNKNGEESMTIFTEYLIKFIKEELNIDISMRNIIDLQCTNSSKFSRHLIIKFPKNIVFKNNIQCGIFVQKLCNKIKIDAQKNKPLQQLFIFKSDPSEHVNITPKLFIDQSVYSRNRTFRLLFSSKLQNIHLKKNAFLTYAPNQNRKSSTTFKEQFYDFLDTLICAIDSNQTTQFIQYATEKGNIDKELQLIPSKYIECSPYPELDEWISKLAKKWGRENAPWLPHMNRYPKNVSIESPLYDAPKNQGQIRTINIDTNNQYIIYAIEKNRFCMNIARCHKSNPIYFIVNCSQS